MPTISDLSNCTPTSVLTKRVKHGHWHLIPYEAEGLSGVMIGAAPMTCAPDVTLPLEASGWHAIHLGFWNPHHDYQGHSRVKLKLTGDPCFQPIMDPAPPLEWPGKCELKEAFFKNADLTGKQLIIAQQSKGCRPHKAYVAYIKLTPLTNGQVAAIQADRANRSTRILYALNDGNGIFYDGPTTAQDLLEEVEQYRHSDVGALLFAVSSGDIVNYPSKIAMPWMADVGDAVGTADRCVLRDSVRTLLDSNVVPVRVMADHCHEMGIGFHAMFRMGIIGDIPPGELWNPHSGFVRRHPELRMLDKDGTPIEKASYAYPEVREFMVSMISELCEAYDVDGVNLGLIRGPHFVGYEDIVVEDFRKQYGIDPRELDENDDRAQQHRASYLNELLRCVRKRLDEIGGKQGGKIELSAMAYTGNYPINLFFGLDVKTWLQERLLDTLFMSLPVEDEVARAVRDANCRLITHLMPNTRDARADEAETLEMALRGFESGVDGFWYWDMNSRQNKPNYWQVLSRTGHRDEVAQMSQSPPRMKTTLLHTVGGYTVNHSTNRGSDERGYWPPEMQPIFSGG